MKYRSLFIEVSWCYDASVMPLVLCGKLGRYLRTSIFTKWPKISI